MNYDHEFVCFEFVMCDIFNVWMDVKFLYTFAWTPWWWQRFVEKCVGVSNICFICIYHVHLLVLLSLQFFGCLPLYWSLYWLSYTRCSSEAVSVKQRKYCVVLLGVLCSSDCLRVENRWRQFIIFGGKCWDFPLNRPRPLAAYFPFF
jgi:hypothetical protein